MTAAEVVEPVPAGLGLVHEHGRSVRATWRGADLFRYVYEPWDPQVESPRPYLHPVRTLGGRVVSLYRPHDHVWHKGLAWSLSNVSLVDPGLSTVTTENFWGGPTYLRAHRGYAFLPNDGRMVHRGFDALSIGSAGGADGGGADGGGADGGGADGGGALRFDQRLTWITESGRTVIEERRRTVVTAHPAASAWRLGFHTTMRNVSGGAIRFGSPTTEGRADAGYSGLFWRGPRSFSGGTVVTPEKSGGDELMGWRGPWIAFVGRHDGDGGASTLLFTDHPANPTYPNQWFVRTGMYAVVSSAPFFSTEYELPDGETLALGYGVFVADGALDAAACAALVSATEAPDPAADAPDPAAGEAR